MVKDIYINHVFRKDEKLYGNSIIECVKLV
jgi:hypothetical protein